MNKRTIPQQLKGIGLVAAAVVSILIAQMAVAKPAYADSSCNTGQLCLWQHARSGGWKLAYTNLTRFRCYTMPSSYWDQVTSYWNRTGHEIIAYSRENCGGAVAWSIYGTEYKGSLSWPFNDEMRSFYTN